MATRPGFIWSGTEWVAIGQEAIVNPFYYQATAPSTPSTGDIWIESDVDVPSVDSAQFLRWRKTMVGGETSLSGNDDSSLPLAYTPGYEQLYINGVLMVRGQDYTATTGTTVTGLTALTVNDVVEVFSTLARTVADIYTQTQIDSKLGESGWTSDTTTVTGTTNPTFTTNTRRWNKIGKQVTVQFSLTFNAVGTGTYTFDLPVTANTTLTGIPVGIVVFRDISVPTNYVSYFRITGSNVGRVFSMSGSSDFSQTVPFTVATGDIVWGTFTYEAA